MAKKRNDVGVELGEVGTVAGKRLGVAQGEWIRGVGLAFLFGLFVGGGGDGGVCWLVLFYFYFIFLLFLPFASSNPPS